MEKKGGRELLRLSIEARMLLREERKGHKPKIQQVGIEMREILDFALH